MPGHSAGSVAIKVSDGEKFVILAADTGYQRASWEKLQLPGPVYDKKVMLKSLKWMQQRAKDGNCQEVIACHDREIVPHVVIL